MKKLIRIFWFSLLLLISNLSFSQTVTLTADYGMTNVSGVTNCGGGKYKFSFKQSAWQVCRFFVNINGTSTNDLGYSGVGCAVSCWTPCRWQSSTSSQGSAVQYYLEVNTTTKIITMTTSNFTCSSATAPTITTTSTPSSISCTSASSGGSGITDGGSAITEKGVCWNTSTNPTISNSKTSNGTGTANFTSSITGLSPGVTYYVRAYATNAIGTSYGNVQSFTTSAIPTQPGTITGTTTQCPSVGSQVYSITAVANATSYNWTVPTGWTINSGAGTNSITVTTGNAGQNGNISVTASNTCGTSTARTLAVTVSTATVAGSISGSTTVCSGSNSGTLTLSGHTGSILRWESSINGTTWSSITNTTTTQNYTNLTTTTQYRAVVQSGSCSSTTTSAVSITVTPTSVGGTASAATATICSGSSTTVSVSGHTGTIQWQQSADGSTGWANVSGGSGATTSTYTTPNLTSTTYYRAVITSGVCTAANSTTATVTVSPTTVAGTINSSATVCSGSNSGTLTLSGHTGNVIRWESSTDGTTWSSITNTTTSQSYTNLTTTTQYRAVVQSGSCSQLTTSSATITVSPITVAGSISGGTTVCSGSNTGSLTLSGHTGSILRWESSTNGTTWNTITNTTTSQSYTNLTTTTQYRAVVQSGSCSSATTSAVSITVSPITVTGSISGGATVCSGSNSGTLTLSGHTGDVLKWETSTNNGSTWSDVSNTTTSQTYTNLTTTTQYRAVVQSGSCTSATTSSVTITVYDVLLSGSISGNQTMCSGVVPDSIVNTVLPSGGNGVYSYQWQSSSNNSTWVNISGQTSKDYYTGALGSSTYYRRAVNSGDCPTAYTASSFIKINTCNGPGGVTNDIIFWLKSDEGVIGSNPITMWQDQSGNEKHAVKSLGNPLKTSTVTNYHPTILFDGNSGFDTDSIIIEQIFIVFKPDTSLSNSSNFQILGRKNHGNINNARVLGFGNKNIISSNDSHSFASEDRIRINGKFNTSLSNTGFNLISIDSENKGKVKDVYKLGQKSVGTSYDNLKGEISEIICYSSKKTGADLNKIETYLSVKYGITLSNNNGGTNGNYYNSNGDLIWDASDNNSYHYDVVGIGKDNVNRLNQKQTKTKDNKLVVFVDNLSSSNEGNTGTITNNRSFVMIGHNNASLKSTVASDLEKPSEIKKRLDREWKITNTNFDDNFNLEIEWDSSGTFDLSDVRLLVDDDGDFTNADVYGPADGLTFRLGSIIVEDVNSSFIPKGSTKYITIGSVDSLTVLPVDLLYFKGEQNGTNVDLKWETGSEINSDYFEVLHSTNGFDFKKIGRLNAAGNSTSCKKYELIHYNAEQGVNYYKLKQYDFGGRYEEYETIMVLFDYITEDYEFLVYPNPNNDNGVVYLKSDYTGEVNIHIFDMKGRVVRKELINIKQNNVETIKDLNLPTGIYPFVISSPNNSFLSKTFKLIIN